ncbi:hypothetical protein [Streptomyces sp. H34-S4]|uniref:hypothetical protein n=1 Tax=Streptomyces sp. H34-S4 TaxID=2996463 RepID=UPI00226EDC89|nr:hypothetical protein [Streptomyces sp. H34-S4]MCY0936012.1 hypothetical protein [Streptomyces sp. H34-S4]
MGLSTGGGKVAVTGRIAAGLDGLPVPAPPARPPDAHDRGRRLRGPAGAALRTGAAGVLRPGDRPRIPLRRLHAGVRRPGRGALPSPRRSPSGTPAGSVRRPLRRSAPSSH